MASSLSEAIIQSVSYQLNPESKAISEYMSNATEKLRRDNELMALDVVSRIRKLIKELKEDGSDPDVLEAYQRMLVRATS
jgi:hypothetical protein